MNAGRKSPAFPGCIADAPLKHWPIFRHDRPHRRLPLVRRRFCFARSLINPLPLPLQREPETSRSRRTLASLLNIL
jgi:hypothetical protein